MTSFILSSHFRMHPITLLLEIWGDGCMGRPPPHFFGGAVPPVPHKSPPLVPIHPSDKECFEMIVKGRPIYIVE